MKGVGVFDRLLDLLMIIGAALIVFDVFAVSLDVMVRYIFGFTYVQLFETVEFTLLWMTFLGTAWLLRERGHVRVELVVSKLSPENRSKFELVVYIAVILLLSILAVYSAKMVIEHVGSGAKLAGVMRPKRWVVEIIIPIGFMFMLVEAIREFVLTLRNIKGRS